MKVPFVVRQETGYQDRDQYKILTLCAAGQAVEAVGSAAAVEPQGAGHPRRRLRRRATAPASAPLADASGDPARQPGDQQQLHRPALGRGFAVMSTALDNTGHNCNIATQAESLLMAKERDRSRQLRRDPVHDRHRLLGRLARAAVDRQRLPRHLPGPDPAAVLVPGRAGHDRRRSSPTTTCSASTSRTRRSGRPACVWLPTQLGAVEGHPDPRQRDPRRRGALQVRDRPDHARDRRHRPSSATTPRRNPGGVRCSVARLHDQHLRPAPRERLVADGAGGRARLRRPAASATPASSTGSRR